MRWGELPPRHGAGEGLPPLAMKRPRFMGVENRLTVANVLPPVPIASGAGAASRKEHVRPAVDRGRGGTGLNRTASEALA